MEVVYAHEEPPQQYAKALFLAGPTPRSADVRSWRPRALDILRERGYDGVVFVPEARNGSWSWDYTDQVEWEETCLNRADRIVFWVPRDVQAMPAFTTNDEWGAWKRSGKCVFGAPTQAVKVRYQQFYADKLGVPAADTLEETLECALSAIGKGAVRQDGERDVPLDIWRTDSFRAWYDAQRAAGNRLERARVEWSFRVGEDRSILFCWILHVALWVASERRVKDNEFVFARPDVSTVALYHRREPIEDSDIVLVREFRSPAANREAMVYGLPGGSSRTCRDPLEIALCEVAEETGFHIAPDRVRLHQTRQVAATLSAHRAHLLTAEITEDEVARLRASADTPYGVSADSERTYVEVFTLAEILRHNLVDWSTLGMILSVFAETARGRP